MLQKSVPFCNKDILLNKTAMVICQKSEFRCVWTGSHIMWHINIKHVLINEMICQHMFCRKKVKYFNAIKLMAEWDTWFWRIIINMFKPSENFALYMPGISINSGSISQRMPLSWLQMPLLEVVSTTAAPCSGEILSTTSENYSVFKIALPESSK